MESYFKMKMSCEILCKNFVFFVDNYGNIAADNPISVNFN